MKKNTNNRGALRATAQHRFSEHRFSEHRFSEHRFSGHRFSGTVAALLAAALVFVLAGCPNEAEKTVEPADKSAITAAIADANTSLATVTVSTNGSDVPANKLWVSGDEESAFRAAINTAKGIEGSSSASEAEVAAAAEALRNAIAIFENAWKPGTGTADTGQVDKTALNAFITSAEKNLASVTKAVAADEVPVGQKWVNYTQYTAYETAITAAKTARDAANDNTAVAAAMSALGTAHTAFNTAKQDGTNTLGYTAYYIDSDLGNDDTNTGKSPRSPWKTFKNVNSREFQPGDRILLEADSIWNGVTTTSANYQTLLGSGTAGILWPKGNGTRDKPCVIDRYDRLDATGDNVNMNSDTITKRPIINGNGTPAPSIVNPYAASGAIHIQGQHFWHIRNIEVTNTFQYADLINQTTRNSHWYNRDVNVVKKALIGIYVAAGTYIKADGSAGAVSEHCIGIVVENCYVHDVQSEHNNNGGTDNSLYNGNTAFGARNTANAAGKNGGGIIVNVTDSRVEGNIVRRVGLEGLRTNHGDWGTNVIFKGNYIEAVAGDGMVMSRVNNTGSTTGANNSLVTSGINLVESNLIKDACAAPNLGSGNYASNWCYYGNDLVYQYNESWGTLYGNLDGEAWDIDNASKRVTYQYNYSHHNAGGTILFMSSGCEDGIFRYNISANDGGSTKYMKTVDQNGLTVDTSAYSYTAFSGGQSLVHYVTGSALNSSVPLVYNNTFYIGDGISLAVYGSTSSGQGNKYTRFYNNILLKAGAGSVTLVNNHNAGSTPSKNSVQNIATGFKNNMFWATNQNQFDHNGAAISTVVSAGSNYWQDPQLKISSEPGAVDALRAQRDDPFPEADNNDAAKLKTYTGKARLRSRASLFAPASGTSNAIKGLAGMRLPSGTGTKTEFDGGWYDGGVTEDFFGNPINSEARHVGAAAAVYTAP